MKIHLKINRLEEGFNIRDEVLSAHVFPPNCINDEYSYEIELIGEIKREEQVIFLVNEHCISDWMDVKQAFYERSEAEKYARIAMREERISRMLSRSGLIPYRRVDYRAVGKHIKTTCLWDLKQYWAAKDKLTEIPGEPIPMSVEVELA
jgi:hypothetical protein